MAHVLSFKTARFDAQKEQPNPINPISGQSVLNWLRTELGKRGYTSTEPDTEDWGWYMDVTGEAGSYLVGASADAEAPTPNVEWTIQVHRTRSLMDKLLGRNKLTDDDPLFGTIERLVRAEPGIVDLTADRNA